jgi:hypothetical protein
VPATVWSRTGPLAQAQPIAQVPRVSGVASFVWIGDDPQVKTPRVTLQFESSPDVWADVTRASGRKVEDNEIVLAYTPDPLQRSGPQTHYWVAEWQAVPWIGAAAVDSLDARGGLPLGTYRFHVTGSEWTLDSDPFEVVAGGLAPTAARATANSTTVIRTTVRWSAPDGWRLMDMSLKSNEPVPVRSQAVTVELLTDTTSLQTFDTTTDASGVVDVTDNVAADHVKVTDRFGNTAIVAL